MKKNWLWLLAGLAACNEPIQLSPDVALHHQHDAALQRQVQRLHAKQIKLSVAAAAAGPAGAAISVLQLEVLNPQEQPEHPDTLRQRVRALARVVVADLVSPDRYKALNAQVTFRQGLFNPDTHSLSFIYPVASLR